MSRIPSIDIWTEYLLTGRIRLLKDARGISIWVWLHVPYPPLPYPHSHNNKSVTTQTSKWLDDALGVQADGGEATAVGRVRCEFRPYTKQNHVGGSWGIGGKCTNTGPPTEPSTSAGG